MQRYKVQFTADQSYVDLLERARDLLQHEIFDRDLARVHRLALEALLEKLSKRKYAGRAAEERSAEQRSAEQPSAERSAEQRSAERSAEQRSAEQPSAERSAEQRSAEQRSAEQRSAEQRSAEQRSAEQPSPTLTPASATRPASPAIASAPVARVDAVPPGAGGRVEQGRYIPSHVKRAVWERDGARCTFTDARGQRCRETSLLEFHHREAYAKGGPTSLGNLTLHCRSHNRLAAEEELGRAFVDNERGAVGGRDAMGKRESTGEARRNGGA